MIRRVIVAAVAAGTLTLGLGGAASAGTAAHTGAVAAQHRHHRPVCLDKELAPVVWPYRAHGYTSLDRWAANHREPVGYILEATSLCEGGYQRKLVTYLDAGDLHALLPKGTRLWVILLPGPI